MVCKKPRVPESIKSKAKASKSTPRGGGFPTSNNISGGLVNNITPLSGHLHMLDACRTLVLDCSHRPIDVVNWQRALCLDIFDKVTPPVIHLYPLGAHICHRLIGGAQLHFGEEGRRSRRGGTALLPGSDAKAASQHSIPFASRDEGSVVPKGQERGRL